MLYRIEILFTDGTTEQVTGDDIAVKDDVLHVWNHHYATGDGTTPDEHIGSYPLAGIRRWRNLEGL